MSVVAVACVACAGIEMSWSGFDEAVFRRIGIPVVLAVLWPLIAMTVLASLGLCRSTKGVWRGVSIVLAAVATTAVVSRYPRYAHEFPALMDILAMVLIVPFAFYAAVTSRLRFLQLLAATTMLGCVAAAVPDIAIRGSASRLDGWLLLPWISTAPLAVAARAALSVSAVPADHDIHLWRAQRSATPPPARSPSAGPQATDAPPCPGA